MLDAVTPEQLHRMQRICSLIVWGGIALSLLTLAAQIAVESRETGRTTYEVLRGILPGQRDERDDDEPRRVPVDMSRARDELDSYEGE